MSRTEISGANRGGRGRFLDFRRAYLSFARGGAGESSRVVRWRFMNENPRTCRVHVASRSDAPLQLFAMAHEHIDRASCSCEMNRYQEKGVHRRAVRVQASRAEGSPSHSGKSSRFVAPRRKTCSRLEAVSFFSNTESDRIRAPLRHRIPKLITSRNSRRRLLTTPLRPISLRIRVEIKPGDSFQMQKERTEKDGIYDRRERFVSSDVSHRDLSESSAVFLACDTRRARFVLWVPIAKEENSACVVPLLRRSSKDFLRVANSRSGVVDLERRLIPQKDILRMNDVNWLNTFPRENASSELGLFA